VLGSASHGGGKMVSEDHASDGALVIDELGRRRSAGGSATGAALGVSKIERVCSVSWCRRFERPSLRC
jgi:hypothetical protein